MSSDVIARVPAAESAAVVAEVLVPLVARGAIVRRPRVVTALDRLDADRRAIRRLQRLREAHGPGPALLALPGRDVAFVLEPGDVRRVLEQSPEPFTPASAEKRAALRAFQPHGVLISPGSERPGRRRFNEAVLDSASPVHRLGGALAAKADEEAGALTAQARRSGVLDWDAFAQAWWRMVRRVTLGDAARDDVELTEALRRLRARANWSFAAPEPRALRERFLARLEGHLARAEPGSLAALVAAAPAPPGVHPSEQVPQWLFAFDAAGMASMRALALLAARPQARERAVAEARAGGAPLELPFLRACVLESVRLWPTTPAILRDTTEPTAWDGGTLPAGTGLVIFAPYLHRDGTRLAQADDFAPELWPGGGRGEAADWPLIPFSDGPVTCPGRNLVLLLTSLWLARLLRDGTPHAAVPGRLAPGAPLPATLSPFRLRLAVR